MQPKFGIRDNFITRGAKLRSRVDLWWQRRTASEKGQVFGAMETSIIVAAVRQFGLSYGNQHAEDVPAVMGLIVREFPGTPMATIAQGHIARALRSVNNVTYTQLSQNLVGSRTQSLIGGSSPTATEVIVSRESKRGDLAHNMTYGIVFLAVAIAIIVAIYLSCRRVLAGK